MPQREAKTAVTTVKFTPEVRDLWERCAEAEHRTLTNLLEVAVRDYAKKLGIQSAKTPPTRTPAKNS